jgi:hypothetical protein
MRRREVRDHSAVARPLIPDVEPEAAYASQQNVRLICLMAAHSCLYWVQAAKTLVAATSAAMTHGAHGAMHQSFRCPGLQAESRRDRARAFGNERHTVAHAYLQAAGIQALRRHQPHRIPHTTFKTDTQCARKQQARQRHLIV